MLRPSEFHARLSALLTRRRSPVLRFSRATRRWTFARASIRRKRSALRCFGRTERLLAAWMHGGIIPCCRTATLTRKASLTFRPGAQAGWTRFVEIATASSVRHGVCARRSTDGPHSGRGRCGSTANVLHSRRRHLQYRSFRSPAARLVAALALMTTRITYWSESDGRKVARSQRICGSTGRSADERGRIVDGATERPLSNLWHRGYTGYPQGQRTLAVDFKRRDLVYALEEVPVRRSAGRMAKPARRFPPSAVRTF